MKASYNIENQLTRIDLPEGRVARYRYDGLGRRIEKRNVPGTAGAGPVGTAILGQDREIRGCERGSYKSAAGCCYLGKGMAGVTGWLSCGGASRQPPCHPDRRAAVKTARGLPLAQALVPLH